jgi:hypothetical protein
MRTLPLAAVIALVSAGAAFSQGLPNQPAPNPSATQGAQSPSQQPIRQQIQNDLSQAGYTDIKIMPESFLVRAKDKRGNPVMMLINPDSITTISEGIRMAPQRLEAPPAPAIFPATTEPRNPAPARSN